MSMDIMTAIEQYNDLTPEEQQRANLYASRLDEKNPNSIIELGEAVQEEIKNFSKYELKKVNSQDVSRTTRSLTELMTRIEEADTKDLSLKKPGFFKRMIGKTPPSIYEVTAKYQRLSAQIEKISIRLNTNKDELLETNAMLDEVFNQSVENYKHLNVVIAAGEIKLKQLNEELLPEMKAKLDSSPNELLNQQYIDLFDYTNRLERQLHDLRISKQLSMQQGSQVRLAQKTNQDLAEKIQSSVSVAIPLWLSQLQLALSLVKQRQAIESQQMAQSATEYMLGEQADEISEILIENQRALESGNIDTKKMKEAQAALVSKIEETIEFQKEASERIKNIEDGKIEERLGLTGGDK